MKTRLYVFSSTGNGLALARQLGDRLGDCEICNLAHELQQDRLEINVDRVGFILPVYCFGLPRIALTFLKRLTWTGRPYCFGVIHCAGSAGAATLQLKKALANHGQLLSAVQTVLMPGNYTPLSGAESKEAQIQKFEKAEIQMEVFAASLRDRDWVHPFSWAAPMNRLFL
ncbi:MAG: EFR1 family ferrodoxin, partial [Planctomycetota bacterium]